MRIPIGFAGLGGGAEIIPVPVPLDNSDAVFVPSSYYSAAPAPAVYDPSTWCVSANTGQSGPCSLMQQDPSAVPLLPLTLGDVLIRCRGMSTDHPCSISGPAPCDPLITAGAGLRCSGGGGPYVTYYGPTGDPMNITAVSADQRAYLQSQGLVDASGAPIPNAPIPTVGPAAPSVSTASPDTAQGGGTNLTAATQDTGEIIPGIPNVVTIGGGAALVLLLLKL